MIKCPLPPRLCILATALLAVPFEAAALITPAGTAANTSSDATFAPTSIWNNVGGAGDSTGEYLGNGWIITANHVSRTNATTINFSLTLGNQSYGWIGTGAQLGSHDIFLAHLAPDTNGNLPDAYGATGVALTSFTPPTTTAATLIANGRTISATNYYLVSGNTWTPVPQGTPGAYPVYSWGPSHLKTWGTNKIWGTTAAGSTIGGSPLSAFTVVGDDALATDFSNGPSATHDPATADETGAALNDSGGGMFVQEGGVWKLAGILDSTDAYVGQPASTTTDGNDTLAIDLSSYASQINAVIAVPEPASGALLGIAGTVFAASVRRRKKSRAD